MHARGVRTSAMTPLSASAAESMRLVWKAPLTATICAVRRA